MSVIPNAVYPSKCPIITTQTLLRRSHEEQGHDGLITGEGALDDNEHTNKRTVFFCSTCHGLIADKSSLLEHTPKRFVNPAGIVFDIIRFTGAPGCVLNGQPSFEYSWFAGHSWCFSLCANCFVHLGWFYQGPTVFYGLIVNRLIEVSL